MIDKSKSSDPSKKSNQQGGNTLLGFIVGLVVGLGIALAVAWSINRNAPQEKVGVRAPTVNLTPKSPSADSGNGSDINAPLKGKKSSDNDSDSAVLATPPAQPAPVTPATVPDKSTSSVVYWLQVGAYASKNDAEGQKANLALQGLQATTSEVSIDDKKMWRVRLGPFDNTQDMQSIRRRLEDSKMSFSVIRSSKS